MKTRLAVVLGLVIALAVFAGAAYAAKGGGYEGAWQAVDFDLSHEWMWIRNFAGVYEVLIYDDACSCCPPDENAPIHFPCLAVGSGRVTTVDWEEGREPFQALVLDGIPITCYTPSGPEFYATGSWWLEYIEGTGILDQFGAMWTPSNDKKPEKVIPAILP